MKEMALFNLLEIKTDHDERTDWKVIVQIWERTKEDFYK